MKIAFYGLGNMGRPMALNLLKAGHRLQVYDPVPACAEPVVKAGAQNAKDAQQALSGVDAVISMLPAGQHVEALYLGERGILASVGKDLLIMECSTIDAETAKRVSALAAQRGVEMVDAPVSGGTAGAEAGTLTFIVGGTQAGYDRAKPILQAMGSNILHAGGQGAGQLAKACNNMLLGVQMAATVEAIRLGMANGLDPKVLSEIMLRSSGANWVLERYNPTPGVMETAPACHDYRPGFMVDLMVKDLGLAVGAAQSAGVSIPMGALARNLFLLHAQQGHGKQDFSSIFELYRQL